MQPAVVQIEARGTFRDPEIGFSDGSGRGSGFLISADGLAVTNNHVVTGAATLEVFVGGDTDESYNATIVGVSECNDLALIQLNTSDELPYLEWYDGEIRAGLDVYAAGFPLGDPEFTLTRGIVAKAEAGGDLTGTSSIDHTVEHDAAIQPGNSGGPLIGADGTVVGVNYAGGAVVTTEQFFAIASDLAQPVVDRLADGDFESLGINGWAVFDDALGISGIWVAGVQPGSPAGDAEIVPGDIVTSMNGLPVGTDGTFADYCDVIRTAGEGAPIQVDVLRYDTQEVLRGEINGDTPIEAAFSFAEEVGSEVGTDEPAQAAAYEYESVVDDLGRITVDVPTAWSDRDTTPIVQDDGTQLPYIAAATSVDGFINTFDVPGLVFAALAPGADVDASLAEYSFEGQCTDGGITDYSDAVFTGKYQLWLDCDGGTTDVVTLVALPADGSYTAIILAQIVTDADLDALDRAFATFNSVG
ncbi:MAG: trypsin-like peptidase domain-containing protein [Acidimicrobiia bacterium]|nr:trypsin-like peptidase domain-containing protein [Acidimicrobiia bacterium]